MIDSRVKYEKFIKDNQDIKYRDFSLKLLGGSKYEVIGIRLPILRKIVSSIDFLSFYDWIDDKYFESLMLQGFVLAKLDDKEFYDRLDTYLNKIDNWSLCDSFCASLKRLKKDKSFFERALKYTSSSDEFIARFGFVVILDYYIDINYADEIINAILCRNNYDYYVNMAVAWLLAEFYITYPDMIVKLLKKKSLDKFTQNKTISKIRDSYKVSKEEKDILKQYRI